MWIEFALIGLLAGYLAGFLGIGGGFIVVPALTFLFLKDPVTAPWAIHMAVATSLSVMLVTSLSSLLAHHRKRAIHWPLVRSMAVGLMAGAILGAIRCGFPAGSNPDPYLWPVCHTGRSPVNSRPPWRWRETTTRAAFLVSRRRLYRFYFSPDRYRWRRHDGALAAVARSASGAKSCRNFRGMRLPNCHCRLTVFCIAGSGQWSAGRDIGLRAPACICRHCIGRRAGCTPGCGYRTSSATPFGTAGVRCFPGPRWHTYVAWLLIWRLTRLGVTKWLEDRQDGRLLR